MLNKDKKHNPDDQVYFDFPQKDDFDFTLIENVLTGKRCGAILTSVFSPEVCKIVAENFSKKTQLSQRTDGAQGDIWGTYHYGKTLQEYLSKANDYQHKLTEIFDGTTNLHAELIAKIQQGLQLKGADIRLAEHENQLAAPFVIRRWKGSGDYSLPPHEDGAQLSAPEQKKFEIQEARKYNLCAVNICLENTEQAKSIVWSTKPTQRDRESHNTIPHGHSYPKKIFEGANSVQILMQPGDIYVFNANHLHAVLIGPNKSGNRLMLSFFMSIIKPQTIIFWS